MSKQHCRSNIQLCCLFSDIVAVLATLSKQRSTLSKGRNFSAKLVRHFCRFWQQSRTLLRHCCQKRQQYRSNIRHCSIRQFCFDIVAGVDRALVDFASFGTCGSDPRQVTTEYRVMREDRQSMMHPTHGHQYKLYVPLTSTNTRKHFSLFVLLNLEIILMHT